MKLGIRVFALLLVMIIVLAGCSEKPATSVDKDVNIQYLPEKVENPDNLPVLNWLCLTDATMGGGPDRVWSEEAAKQLNQMLADRNMPFRITCMSYANGVFKADVNNGQTTSRYIGGPWYFSYLML